MSDAMRIDYVPLLKVIGATRNPKLHNYEELANSIRRFGFCAPIAMDERTGRLVAGHGRLETLRRMQEAGEEMPVGVQVKGKQWCVPVVRGVEFENDQEAEAFIIADNRISAIGGWEEDALREILLEQIDMVGTLEGIGFDENDLMNLADAVAAMPLLDDEQDEEPEDTDEEIDCAACNGEGCEVCDPVQEQPVSADATDEEDEEFEPEVTEPDFDGDDFLDVGKHRIYCGDCVEVLKSMPDNSVDSIVCDPPYGIGFMSKNWDVSVPGIEWAQECLRVLKPGGHIIAFAATRTVHRLAVSIEDAGFEIRDTISWLYWTGFPKSMNVSKAIDQHLGAEREVIGKQKLTGTARIKGGSGYTVESATDNYQTAELRDEIDITAPGSPEAAQWDGWGTALKPAQEPAILARKPISEKTVAANVLEHGTGAINIDACRFAAGDPSWPGPQGGTAGTNCKYHARGEECAGHESNGKYGKTFHVEATAPSLPSPVPQGKQERAVYGVMNSQAGELWEPSEQGRFPANIFVCTKPHRSEKEAGLDDFAHATAGEVTGGRKEGSAGLDNPRAGAGRTSGAKNIHPTVKPVRLMRWLVRLVTPENGIVMDTFLGSGTTMVAAQREGFSCIGIELDPMFATIAKARVEHAIDD